MICGLFSELLSPGGVQTAGRQTAAALFVAAERRGLPCRFLSLNDPPGRHEIIFPAAAFSFEGLGGRREGFFAAAMGAALRGRGGFVWAGHPNLAPVALATKYLAPRLRTIVCVHGIEVWSQLPRLRRLSLRRANLIVAPSRYTAEMTSAQQGISSARIHCLPWALDPAFESLAAAFSSSPPPPGIPSGPMILTVGRWSAEERYKGLDELIEAMPAVRARVPNAFLAAVGDGNDRPRLEEKAAALVREGVVYFVNAAQGPALASFYHRCDVFALPSRGEGFGLVFLEAMAFSKPLIGAPCGGIPDVLTDGENGYLVAPSERAKLVATLVELLLNRKLREDLGKRGKLKLQKEFLFPVFAARVDGILDKAGLPS